MESARKRFAWKLGASVVVAVSGFATQMSLMRVLGAVGYGRIAFLQSHFEQVFALLDLGIAAAGFSLMARAPTQGASWALGRLVQGWVGVCALVSLLYVVVASGMGYSAFLWPEIGLPAVGAALVAGAAVTWFARLQSVFDAQGRSVGFERIRVARTILTLACIGALALPGALNVGTYFLATGALALVGCAWGLVAMRPAERALLPSSSVPALWLLAKPLAVYAVLGGAATLAERWILQTAGGAREQGFAAAAGQVGAAIFLFSAAFVPVFTAEAGRAIAASDGERVKTLVWREARLFFALTALVAATCAALAPTLMRLLGGVEFREAGAAAALLFLVPIHQVYGQIWGSLATVSGGTRTYALIGALGLLVGLALTYVLVGSPSWNVPGLGLGAYGYAVRALVGQFISVTLLVFAFAPRFGVSRRALARADAATLLLAGACAWSGDAVGARVAKALARLSEGPAESLSGTVLHLVVAGVTSLSLFAAIASWRPRLLGLDSSTSARVRSILGANRFRRSPPRR